MSETARQLTEANEALSAFKDDLKKEREKKGLGRKADLKEWYESANQRSLTFYAFNDCNKGSLRSGFNHVQLYFVFKKPSNSKSGNAYYVMEYSKNVPKREGQLPSKYKDTPTAVQLPLDKFNPPQFENNKIKVTYTDKKGKICNVLLGPCNTPEKEQEYKCPVRGKDFANDKDWKDKVTIWFKTKLFVAIDIARIPTEWKGEKITMEEALAPLKNPDTVSENPKILELSKQVQEISEGTDKIAEKTSEEAEEHLADAERKLKEHDNAMKEVDKTMNPELGTATTEEKTGGKKSRKKRRTKRRKSIRRKKGKKSKKH